MQAKSTFCVDSVFKCVVVFNCNSMEWRFNAREFVVSMEKFSIIKRGEYFVARILHAILVEPECGSNGEMQWNLTIRIWMIQCSIFAFVSTFYLSIQIHRFPEHLACYVWLKTFIVISSPENNLSKLHFHSLVNAGGEWKKKWNPQWWDSLSSWWLLTHVMWKRI